jgi:hypothetical protein
VLTTQGMVKRNKIGTIRSQDPKPIVQRWDKVQRLDGDGRKPKVQSYPPEKGLLLSCQVFTSQESKYLIKILKLIFENTFQ